MMMLYAVLVVVGVGAITLAFLHPPPEHAQQAPRATSGAGRNASTLGLPPNLLMALLMLAFFGTQFVLEMVLKRA